MSAVPAWTVVKFAVWVCIASAFVAGWIASGNGLWATDRRGFLVVGLPIVGWFVFLFSRELNINRLLVYLLFVPAAVISALFAVYHAMLAYDPMAFAK